MKIKKLVTPYACLAIGNLWLAGLIFICNIKYPNLTTTNILYIAVIVLAAALPKTKHIGYFAVLALGLTMLSQYWSTAARQTNLCNANQVMLMVALIISAIATIISKRQIAKHKASAAKNLAILDTAIVPIITIEGSQIIEFASGAVEHIFGWQPQELIGQHFTALLAEPFASQYKQYFADFNLLQLKHPLPIKSEVTAKRKDDTCFACEIAIVNITTPKIPQAFFAIGLRDISERKTFEEKMVWLSNHDELTGLYNRRYFNRQIAIEWHRLMRTKSNLGLMLIDVDDFKKYNDTLGHMAGDLCLKLIAGTINSIINRAGDFAARYGGEEFVLLLPNTDQNGITHLARKLQQAIEKLDLAHPCSSHGQQVTASIGLTSMLPGNASNLDVLIQQADHALYQAKNSGKNCYQLYTPAPSVD